MFGELALYMTLEQLEPSEPWAYPAHYSLEALGRQQLDDCDPTHPGAPEHVSRAHRFYFWISAVSLKQATKSYLFLLTLL
jgi:hypothetical protein